MQFTFRLKQKALLVYLLICTLKQSYRIDCKRSHDASNTTKDLANAAARSSETEISNRMYMHSWDCSKYEHSVTILSQIFNQNIN